MKTMNFSKTTILAATFLFSTAMVSCKKEDSKHEDHAPCTTNVASLAGSYKIETTMYKQNAASTELDLFSFLSPCMKDDVITLKADGSWMSLDAGTVCTPAGSDDGQWLLNNNALLSDGPLSGTLKGFDCKKLVLINKDIYVAGDQLITTAVKQ
jgi:hypothetical protein